MHRFVHAALLGLALVACTPEPTPGGGSQPPQQPPPQQPTAAGQPETPESGGAAPADGGAAKVVAISAPEVHDAMCGHALPGVGHCGNYVKLGEEWVEITHPSLGVMEWCKQGKAGAKVAITGQIEDGKFVAKSLETVN